MQNNVGVFDRNVGESTEFTVPAYIRQYRLNPEEKAVLLEYRARLGSGEPPPSISTLANVCVMSERSVKIALKTLEAAGVIERVTIPGKVSHVTIQHRSGWAAAGRLPRIREAVRKGEEVDTELTPLNSAPPTNLTPLKNDPPPGNNGHQISGNADTNLRGVNSAPPTKMRGVKIDPTPQSNPEVAVFPVQEELMPIETENNGGYIDIDLTNKDLNKDQSILSKKGRKKQKEYAFTEQDFEEWFWPAVKAKEKRQVCLKKFTTIPSGVVTKDVILEALVRRQEIHRYHDGNLQYMPMVSTWLNQRLWEDDLEALEDKKSAHSGKPRLYPRADGTTEAPSRYPAHTLWVEGPDGRMVPERKLCRTSVLAGEIAESSHPNVSDRVTLSEDELNRARAKRPEPIQAAGYRIPGISWQAARTMVDGITSRYLATGKLLTIHGTVNNNIQRSLRQLEVNGYIETTKEKGKIVDFRETDKLRLGPELPLPDTEVDDDDDDF